MNTKISAYSGLLTLPAFSLLLIIFSLLTPGYNNLVNAVSELGISGAPHALAWNMFGFVFIGLLVIFFARGLYAGLRLGPGAVTVASLVFLSGIGFAGLGFFPADPGFRPSAATSLYFTMVSVNYLPFIIFAFLFALTQNKDVYWRHWVVFSLAMGALAIMSFFLPPTIPPGISQRIGMGTYFLWIMVMSFALLRKTESAQE